MSGKTESTKTLMKLKDTKYDLTEFTSEELENLQKYSPKIIEAVSALGEVSSKSQEKVYNIIDRVITIFADQLKDPNLSDKDRDKIFDRMERMVDKAVLKDSEFKKFIYATIFLGVGGLGTAAVIKNPVVRKAAVMLLTKGK